MFKQKSEAYINVKGKKYQLISCGGTEKGYLDTIKNKEHVFYLENSILDRVGVEITYDNAVKIKDWLTEMIEFVENSKTEQKKEAISKTNCSKKEGNNMSKQYTFIEMLQEYENGYKGEFNKSDEKNTIIVNNSNSIYFKKESANYNKLFNLTEANIKSKYTKIEQEVTPDIAIKALMEGKTIKSIKDDNNNEYIYSLDESKRTENLINLKEFKEEYKWYIED